MLCTQGDAGRVGCPDHDVAGCVLCCPCWLNAFFPYLDVWVLVHVIHLGVGYDLDSVGRRERLHECFVNTVRAQLVHHQHCIQHKDRKPQRSSLATNDIQKCEQQGLMDDIVNDNGSGVPEYQRGRQTWPLMTDKTLGPLSPILLSFVARITMSWKLLTMCS